MSSKIITVIGATGTQGGSVVNALHGKSGYTVRAVTRDPSSEAAKALALKGIEVVAGDANDYDSLVKAFAGSAAVFSVTNFWGILAQQGLEKAFELETANGIAIAKAALATPTLEHFVWSSVPNPLKLSGGKRLIPHFEAKNRVDQYIESEPELLAKTTFLWVGYYGNNVFYYPQYFINAIGGSEHSIQLGVYGADVPLTTIGDPRVNIGRFVKAVLENPGKTLPGKVVLAAAEETTVGGYLEAWSAFQKKPATYVQIPADVFDTIWPVYGKELRLMHEFWDWAREKSWTGDQPVLTKEDLGLTNLVGIQETFATFSY
jgi:hypothetical protein